MKKLLFGLLGVTAAFGVVTVVLLMGTAKPASERAAPAPPDIYAAAGGDAGAAEDSTGRYATPEQLAADYARAAQVVVSTYTLSRRLAEYFACASLVQNSDAVCAQIDKHLDGRRAMTCRRHRLSGLRMREIVRGSGEMEHCVNDYAHYNELYGYPTNRKEIAEGCRNERPFQVRGDVAGFCRNLLTHEHDPHDGERGGDVQETMAGCEREHAYLRGDPERCAIQEDELERERCTLQASLLKALRRQEASFAADTPYAPLVDDGASCAALGARAREEYERSAREYSAIQQAMIRSRRFEAQERDRGQRERAVSELRTREQAAAEEVPDHAETEHREEAPRGETAEEKLRKFEEARRADEARRSEQGLKMRDQIDAEKQQRQ
ncbi:MAG: hypothetical protein ABIJ96_13005 [Elusimicrobiota bacterium]